LWQGVEQLAMRASFEELPEGIGSDGVVGVQQHQELACARFAQ
jgi:hypothetical protein